MISEFNTLMIERQAGILTVTFNRLSHRNSITPEFLNELNEVLHQVERDNACKIVILQGQAGIFCTGMDLDAAVSREEAQGTPSQPMTDLSSGGYMQTLRRLSLISRVIVSNVDGQVMAGGVGIAAASDLVIATPRSQFSLSEALWGLMPSMVIPYLIRRVGFQKAYRMTLTTMPVPAAEARDYGLVDELTENPPETLRQFQQRLLKLETSTIGNIKSYFRKMWLVTEELENMAAAETARLMSEPAVRENISNFVKYKKFPWEKNPI